MQYEAPSAQDQPLKYTLFEGEAELYAHSVTQDASGQRLPGSLKSGALWLWLGGELWLLGSTVFCFVSAHAWLWGGALFLSSLALPFWLVVHQARYQALPPGSRQGPCPYCGAAVSLSPVAGLPVCEDCGAPLKLEGERIYLYPYETVAAVRQRQWQNLFKLELSSERLLDPQAFEALARQYKDCILHQPEQPLQPGHIRAFLGTLLEESRREQLGRESPLRHLLQQVAEVQARLQELDAQMQSRQLGSTLPEDLQRARADLQAQLSELKEWQSALQAQYERGEALYQRYQALLGMVQEQEQDYELLQAYRQTSQRSAQLRLDAALPEALLQLKNRILELDQALETGLEQAVGARLAQFSPQTQSFEYMQTYLDALSQRLSALEP